MLQQNNLAAVINKTSEENHHKNSEWDLENKRSDSKAK